MKRETHKEKKKNYILLFLLVNLPFNSKNEGKPVAIVIILIYFSLECLCILENIGKHTTLCQKGKNNLHIKTDVSILCQFL